MDIGYYFCDWVWGWYSPTGDTIFGVCFVWKASTQTWINLAFQYNPEWSHFVMKNVCMYHVLNIFKHHISEKIEAFKHYKEHFLQDYGQNSNPNSIEKIASYTLHLKPKFVIHIS